MRKLVHVLHPVPRTVMRRDRPAFDVSSAVTPVELREIAPAEIETFAERSAQSYHIIDGRLWLSGRPQHTGQDQVARFVEFLESHQTPRWPLSDIVECSLVRTPVMMAHGAASNPVRTAVPAKGVQSVLDDGRDKAAAAVRRFLDEEVRVCEGTVYVRCFGPFAFLGADGQVRAQTYGRWLHDLPGAARVDRIGEMRGLLGRVEDHHVALQSAPLLSELPPIPSELLADDDILLHANFYPALAAHFLHAVTTRVEDPETSEALLAMIRDLGSLACEGFTGGIGQDRAQGALEMAAEGMREARRIYAEALTDRRMWARRMNVGRYELPLWHIEEVLLPRVRPHDPMADVDASTLGGMSAGML